VEGERADVAEYNLLKKTELRIEGISLKGANLNDIANVTAEVLGMDHSEVLVTDFQDDRMTLDVLRKSVDAHAIVGKHEKLLRRLGELPGVGITADASVSSDGMLGWIAFDVREAGEALERSEKIAEGIRHRISRRAIIFSTGREVETGRIEDTNRPALAKRLEAEGYAVRQGPTLKDDRLLIAAALRQAAEDEGFGLVITTGGVGAEAKDQTVEAVLELDPGAATPYICRYEVGAGRHHKDGVRIAVGWVGETMVVALPGPNDEVRACLDILAEGLVAGLDKHALAEGLAGNLRELLRGKMTEGVDREGPTEGANPRR
jgi:molybdenum cofactor synthesis domain-containing protein